MRPLVRLIVRWYRSPAARSVLGLLCLALMLVAANVLAARFLPLQLDLTADRLYTLSPAALRALARIDEPITMRFYYSRRLAAARPSWRGYTWRVRELLGLYVAASHGKLRLEAYDPRPLSAAAAQAAAFGLRPVPLERPGEEGYFGLAASNSTDDVEVIPLFSPDRENRLEYDLTRLIGGLVSPGRPPVAPDLAGPPDQGGTARRLTVMQRLRHQADRRYAARRQELARRLDEAEAKLRHLMASKAPPSPDEAQTIERLRADVLMARRQLRAATAARDGGVRHLELTVEIVDTGLVPLLVAGAALLVAGRGRRRRRALSA